MKDGQIQPARAAKMRILSDEEIPSTAPNASRQEE